MENDKPIPAGDNGEPAPVEMDHPDRLAQPVDLEAPPRLPFQVIGIGASAGGLEAFLEFFQALPPDAGMAYVLVQHLPPDRESMVADILSRHTQMKVVQVEDKMPVEVNTVYVIRPGHTLTIHEGLLHLGAPIELPGHRRPVDDFFRSLAEEQRERAICVVMSGMGSNGAAGAQNIKAVGGVCIAQDPETAKFPGMPRSLINAGLADLILRPQDMPQALIRYASHPYAQSRVADAPEAQDRQAFAEILSILRTRSRQDFTGYKKPTVLRRIQRRMGLQHVIALPEYAQLLRSSPTEASELADDLVIHVTGFFRDPDAWEALRTRVIQPLVAQREADVPIRAWVVACSSGEEAYTLAMLLHEAAEASQKVLDIKIFATDVADRTLSQARNGIYPLGIEGEVSPERLERFFDRDNASYRIKRELRELVIFAPQNVLQDPPFSRLDLCTCRNLLIYLEPEMQRRVLSLLHFALVPGGALFLGTSETVAGSDGMFETVDKKWRIYHRGGSTLRRPLDFPLAVSHHTLREPTELSLQGPPRASLQHLAQRLLIERHTPAAVVVNQQHRVVYFHGDTSPFLVQPTGEPTRDLLAMVRESVRGAVRIALHRASEEMEPVSVPDGFIDTLDGRRRVIVTCAALETRLTSPYQIVVFEERPEPEPAVSADPNGLAGPLDESRLAEQLRRVRDELQSTIEELQTSNEELKASNEEVTSVNEELQSTNEELETSKEELQSLNEELITVNAQLEAKMEELEAIGSDLSSLLASTDIAVVFLDRQFRIRRFTPAVLDLFDLIATDVGRPLADLARKFTDPDLTRDAQLVLDRLVPLEKQVLSASARWYTRRVLPYRTTDDRIEGVVITFVDITRSPQAESDSQRIEERYSLMLKNIRDFAILRIGVNGLIETWNVGAELIFGYTDGEVIGKHFRLIFTPEDRAAGIAEKELAKAEETGQAEDERWHLHCDGRRFWGSGMTNSLLDAEGKVAGFVKVMRDNTERKLSEDSLRQAQQAAEAANEAKDQFLATVSHELRTPLSAILLWSQMINQTELPPHDLREATHAIERNAEVQKRLIEDLLDTARIYSGKLRLAIQPIDVTAAIRAAMEAIQPTALAKGVTLCVDLAPEVGVVAADADRLRQIAWNLISNAVKFTPAEGKVSIGLVRDEEGIKLSVADTGPGVAPDLLPRIFDRFFQSDHPTPSTGHGLGLGLAITKQLVELHGGRIWVENPNDAGGATFVVRLPLPRLASGAMRNAAFAAGEAGRLSGVRVLLVEDDTETRKAISALLASAKVHVVEVASAIAALDAFENHRPDIIICDIGLPDIDGNALLTRIRASEKTTNSPAVLAIALTAFAYDKDRQSAIAAGFDRFLTKPANSDELLAAVAELVKR